MSVIERWSLGVYPGPESVKAKKHGRGKSKEEEEGGGSVGIYLGPERDKIKGWHTGNAN